MSNSVGGDELVRWLHRLETFSSCRMAKKLSTAICVVTQATTRSTVVIAPGTRRSLLFRECCLSHENLIPPTSSNPARSSASGRVEFEPGLLSFIPDETINEAVFFEMTMMLVIRVECLPSQLARYGGVIKIY